MYFYKPWEAAAFSTTYVLVVVYSLDQYVVDHLIYLFVSGLYSLACFHLLDLYSDSANSSTILDKNPSSKGGRLDEQ